MRQIRDRGEKLSQVMIDLIDAFESWDTQQFMASGAKEWREFYRALEKVWSTANHMDAGS